MDRHEVLPEECLVADMISTPHQHRGEPTVGTNLSLFTFHFWGPRWLLQLLELIINCDWTDRADCTGGAASSQGSLSQYQLPKKNRIVGMANENVGIVGDICGKAARFHMGVAEEN
jgi:hypothetical protein